MGGPMSSDSEVPQEAEPHSQRASELPGPSGQSGAEPAAAESLSRMSLEESESRGDSPKEEQGVKLFVGGLAWETDEEKLKEYFSQYGRVTKAVVLRQRLTCRPRGFGFVTFEGASVAEKVVGKAHMIDGRQIEAKPSVPRDRPQPRLKKIFVGGLAPDTTEDMFKQYFEQFGVVTEAQIMVDHTTHRSRGFGFVTFEDEESVLKVFQHGNRHRLGSRDVEVKEATPRGSGPVGGRGVSGRGRGGLARQPGGGRGTGSQGYSVNPYPVVYGMPMSYSGYAGAPYGYSMMTPYPPAQGGYAYGPYPQPGAPYMQQPPPMRPGTMQAPAHPPMSQPMPGRFPGPR